MPRRRLTATSIALRIRDTAFDLFTGPHFDARNPAPHLRDLGIENELQFRHYVNVRLREAYWAHRDEVLARGTRTGGRPWGFWAYEVGDRRAQLAPTHRGEHARWQVAALAELGELTAAEQARIRAESSELVEAMTAGLRRRRRRRRD